MNSNSSDRNTQFLNAAAAIMNELDLRYMDADLDGKMQLKDDLDQAMLNFSEVQQKLLANQMRCSADDVAQMQLLQKNVEKAAAVQTLVQAAIRFTGLLTKFI